MGKVNDELSITTTPGGQPLLDINMHYYSKYAVGISNSFMRYTRFINVDEHSDAKHALHEAQDYSIILAHFIAQEEHLISKSLSQTTVKELYSYASLVSVPKMMKLIVRILTNYKQMDDFKSISQNINVIALSILHLLTNYYKPFMTQFNSIMYNKYKHSDNNLVIMPEFHPTIQFFHWYFYMKAVYNKQADEKILNALLDFAKSIEPDGDDALIDAIASIAGAKIVKVAGDNTKFDSLMQSLEYDYWYISVNSASDVYNIIHSLSTCYICTNTMLGIHTTNSTDRLMNYVHLNVRAEQNNKRHAEVTMHFNYEAKTTDDKLFFIAIDDVVKEDNYNGLNEAQKQFIRSSINELKSIKVANSKQREANIVYALVYMYIMSAAYYDKMPLNRKNLIRTVFTSFLHIIDKQEELMITKLANSFDGTNNPVVSYPTIKNLVLDDSDLTVLPKVDDMHYVKKMNCIDFDTFFNLMYKQLNISDELYVLDYGVYDTQPIEKIVELCNTPTTKSNLEFIKTNKLIAWLIRSLRDLDTLLKQLDCDKNVFDAYDSGMSLVYETYPELVDFFRTFYALYPLGILAECLNDKTIALNYVQCCDRIDILTVTKKLRKRITTNLRLKQEEENKQRLEQLKKEREAALEAKRQAEAELAASIEAERLKKEEEERKATQLQNEADAIMEELHTNSWAGFTKEQQDAAYVRNLTQGMNSLEAAQAVKDLFNSIKKEEEDFFKELEREDELRLLNEAENRKKAEKLSAEQMKIAKKEHTERVNKEYEDMSKGLAIFEDYRLSAEERKTAPKLSLYDIAKLFPHDTNVAKLRKLVSNAPADELPTDTIGLELLRLIEVTSKRIKDPIDGEIMTSTRSLASKHGVTEKQVVQLTEAGLPLEQALAIVPKKLKQLAQLYKADEIYYDRAGRYIVCKGEFIVPVTYHELKELLKKLKVTKQEGE